MVLLWDLDAGMSQIPKYMESSDDYVVAGSYIAMGIVNSGIRSQFDAAKAILQERLNSNK